MMSDVRTACYARFSSELQRETSLDDQIRTCREYAERQGFLWQDSQVFTDAAISGSSIDGRAGLQALLIAAASHPRPFDVLLVDDSSRVARDLADALRVVQRLKFAGVRAVYISQGIDSASEQAETLIAVHGLIDSTYLREMATKIRRGLVGQLERGYSTGGAHFGYRSVPIIDPSGRRDNTGQPLRLGNRLEIDEAQAAVVRRAFERYASGHGVRRIIDDLNQERLGGRRWTYATVNRLLHNERYRGLHIYGQVRFERVPGTRKKVRRPRPHDEWRITERPELRIISDELWKQVEEQRRAILAREQRQLHGTLLRGRSAAHSSKHLFSGFLTCGTCGGSVVIVHHGYGSPRFGCINHHKNGRSSCTNKLTVRSKIAEPAMLAGLQAELQRPDTTAYISSRLSAALNALRDARPAQRAALEQARQETQQKLGNLITAVEDGAGAAAMYRAIQARETELATIAEQLAALETTNVEARLAVLPTWVAQQLHDVASLLSAGALEETRSEFRRLGVRFVLHPVYDEGARPFLRAEGCGDFEQLAFNQYAPLRPTADRSPLR